MNKPAPKEPSMDEILSSIRQIIADDDAGAAPKKPVAPAPAPARSFVPRPPEPEPEPLALSSEQILRDTAAEDEAKPGLSFSELLGGAAPAPDLDATLVDPDDISFDLDDDEPTPAPVFTPPPRAAVPAYERPAPRPAASVAMAAPMPDPSLSSDIAEQLLEPTTQSAVKSTFARLSGLSTVTSGVTIEDMMREMLRPMLKEWLDENLPSVVERMV
jgi:cell pole-organizing protein PopZ